MAASKPAVERHNLDIAQNTFEILTGESLDALVRTPEPELNEVVKIEKQQEEMPLFAEVLAAEAENPPAVAGLGRDEIGDQRDRGHAVAAEESDAGRAADASGIAPNPIPAMVCG